MQRRFCLTLLASGAALGVTGCGFELRKAPNFSFKTLFSPFAESSTLGHRAQALAGIERQCAGHQ